MSIFEEIKVGDRIVIRPSEDWWNRGPQLLRIELVTKVTATQITAGGKRFMKNRGWEYGQDRHAARISTVYSSNAPERLMTPEEAEAKNKEIKRELDHKALAYRIRDIKFIELSYETLLKLAEVLGLEVESDDNQT